MNLPRRIGLLKRHLFTRATMSVPRSEQKDLHLITQSTPNGKKIQIALEELKLKYGTDWSFELLDIDTNRQKEDWFLKLNPNGRIPVLVDNKEAHLDKPNEPFTVMETSAILLYLAKKVDKDNAFSSTDPLERSDVLQWLFFSHGGVGPMQGQYHHFSRKAPEKLPYAVKRYRDETLRLYGVIEIQLSGKYTGVEREYLAGPGKGIYSWADMAAFPWVNRHKYPGITDDEMKSGFPHVWAWLRRIEARPAVQIAIGDKYKCVLRLTTFSNTAEGDS